MTVNLMAGADDDDDASTSQLWLGDASEGILNLSLTAADKEEAWARYNARKERKAQTKAKRMAKSMFSTAPAQPVIQSPDAVRKFKAAFASWASSGPNDQALGLCRTPSESSPERNSSPTGIGAPSSAFSNRSPQGSYLTVDIISDDEHRRREWLVV
mmetsp:Transcript_61222/g.145757  ORF Transcript_61222/g.145757 Transcript_61222/m.145757 type:complete len:157 (+) Transcript_61222:88-558(+)